MVRWMRRDEEGWDRIIPVFMVFDWESALDGCQEKWDKLIPKIIADELVPPPTLPYLFCSPCQRVAPLQACASPSQRRRSRQAVIRSSLQEMCCIIGTWVRDHLLREAWPGPLGMSPRVVARVSLHRRPWRLDPPPPGGLTARPWRSLLL
jgi:hypothetical protein